MHIVQLKSVKVFAAKCFFQYYGYFLTILSDYADIFYRLRGICYLCSVLAPMGAVLSQRSTREGRVKELNLNNINNVL